MEKKFDELLNEKCSWSYRSQKVVKSNKLHANENNSSVELHSTVTTVEIQNKYDKGLSDTASENSQQCLKTETRFHNTTKRGNATKNVKRRSMKNTRGCNYLPQRKVLYNTSTAKRRTKHTIPSKSQAPVPFNSDRVLRKRNLKPKEEINLLNSSSDEEQVLQTRYSLKENEMYNQNEDNDSFMGKTSFDEENIEENISHTRKIPIIIQAIAYDKTIKKSTNTENKNLEDIQVNENEKIVNEEIHRTPQESYSGDSLRAEPNTPNSEKQITPYRITTPYSDATLHTNIENENFVENICEVISVHHSEHLTDNESITEDKEESESASDNHVISDFLNGSLDVSGYKNEKNKTFGNFGKADSNAKNMKDKQLISPELFTSDNFLNTTPILHKKTKIKQHESEKSSKQNKAFKRQTGKHEMLLKQNMERKRKKNQQKITAQKKSKQENYNNNDSLTEDGEEPKSASGDQVVSDFFISSPEVSEYRNERSYGAGNSRQADLITENIKDNKLISPELFTLNFFTVNKFDKEGKSNLLENKKTQNQNTPFKSLIMEQEMSQNQNTKRKRKKNQKTKYVKKIMQQNSEKYFDSDADVILQKKTAVITRGRSRRKNKLPQIRETLVDWINLDRNSYDETENFNESKRTITDNTLRHSQRHTRNSSLLASKKIKQIGMFEKSENNSESDVQILYEGKISLPEAIMKKIDKIVNHHQKCKPRQNRSIHNHEYKNNKGKNVNINKSSNKKHYSQRKGRNEENSLVINQEMSLKTTRNKRTTSKTLLPNVSLLDQNHVTSKKEDIHENLLQNNSMRSTVRDNIIFTAKNESRFGNKASLESRNNLRSTVNYKNTIIGKRQKTWDDLENELINELDTEISFPDKRNVSKTIVMTQEKLVRKKDASNDAHLVTVSNKSMTQTIRKLRNSGSFNIECAIQNTESNYLESASAIPSLLKEFKNTISNEIVPVVDPKNMSIVEKTIAAMEHCTAEFNLQQVYPGQNKQMDMQKMEEKSDISTTSYDLPLSNSDIVLFEESTRCTPHKLTHFKKSYGSGGKSMQCKSSNILKTKDNCSVQGNYFSEHSDDEHLKGLSLENNLAENTVQKYKPNIENKEFVLIPKKAFNPWDELMKKLNLEKENYPNLTKSLDEDHHTNENSFKNIFLRRTKEIGRIPEANSIEKEANEFDNFENSESLSFNISEKSGSLKNYSLKSGINLLMNCKEKAGPIKAIEKIADVDSHYKKSKRTNGESNENNKNTNIEMNNLLPLKTKQKISVILEQQSQTFKPEGVGSNTLHDAASLLNDCAEEFGNLKTADLHLQLKSEQKLFQNEASDKEPDTSLEKEESNDSVTSLQKISKDREKKLCKDKKSSVFKLKPKQDGSLKLIRDSSKNSSSASEDTSKKESIKDQYSKRKAKKSKEKYMKYLSNLFKTENSELEKDKDVNTSVKHLTMAISNDQNLITDTNRDNDTSEFKLIAEKEDDVFSSSSNSEDKSQASGLLCELFDD